MKRCGPRHPKITELSILLGLPQYATVGLCEMLWHVTHEFAHQGDIGKFSDEHITRALSYDGDATILIQSFVKTRLIDECPCHRLRVHDWPEHCGGTVKHNLKKREEDFLSCYNARSVLRQSKDDIATVERQSKDNVTTVEPSLSLSLSLSPSPSQSVDPDPTRDTINVARHIDQGQEPARPSFLPLAKPKPVEPGSLDDLPLAAKIIGQRWPGLSRITLEQIWIKVSAYFGHQKISGQALIDIIETAALKWPPERSISQGAGVNGWIIGEAERYLKSEKR